MSSEVPLLSGSTHSSNLHFVQNSITTSTDAKIRKVVLSILAAISFAIGYLSLVVGTGASLIIAIPSLTVAGYLMWTVKRVKDYQDPEMLERYRNEASYRQLEATAKEHGWVNMLQYEIPRKGDFPAQYNAMMLRARNFNDLIALYEIISAARQKCMDEDKPVPFEIPDPGAFKTRFTEEIQGKSLLDLFGQYDFEKLYQYGIINKSSLTAEKNYLESKANLKAAIKEAQATFLTQCSEAVERFEQVLNIAQGGTHEQKGWIIQLKANLGYFKQGHQFHMPIISDEELRSLEYVKEAGTQFCEDVAAATDARDSSIKRTKDNFDALRLKLGSIQRI